VFFFSFFLSFFSFLLSFFTPYFFSFLFFFLFFFSFSSCITYPPTLVPNMTDTETENFEAEEGAALINEIIPITEGVAAASYLFPNYDKLNFNGRATSLHGLHQRAAFLFGAGTIAFWVVVGVLSATLGMGRIIPITVTQVTGGGTGDAFNRDFAVTTRHISDFPPTVIIAVVATLQFIYHAAHVWNPAWIKRSIKFRTNWRRWLSQACFKSLLFSVLFLFNGERELTAFMYLSAAVAGACIIAHAFEYAVSANCQTKGTTTSKKTMGLCEDVVTYGQALCLVTAVIAVAFVLRLAYNGKGTPEWVMPLSVVVLVYEIGITAYYINSTYGCKANDAKYESCFVSGERWIIIANVLGFSAIASITFGYVATM